MTPAEKFLVECRSRVFIAPDQAYHLLKMVDRLRLHISRGCGVCPNTPPNCGECRAFEALNYDGR